jgi:hypothetical protein
MRGHSLQSVNPPILQTPSLSHPQPWLYTSAHAHAVLAHSQGELGSPQGIVGCFVGLRVGIKVGGGVTRLAAMVVSGVQPSMAEHSEHRVIWPYSQVFVKASQPQPNGPRRAHPQALVATPQDRRGDPEASEKHGVIRGHSSQSVSIPVRHCFFSPSQPQLSAHNAAHSHAVAAVKHASVVVEVRGGVGSTLLAVRGGCAKNCAMIGQDIERRPVCVYVCVCVCVCVCARAHELNGRKVDYGKHQN